MIILPSTTTEKPKRLKIDADIFLFDLDGTIYLGDEPIPGALDLLHFLRELKKQVFFLTNNSSKTVDEYLVKLKKIGYIAEDYQIITSTLASINYLKTHHLGKSVFPLGTAAFSAELIKNEIKISENADIVLLAFDTDLNYNKLWRANVLLDSGALFVATHPDLTCPSDIGNMPDVGSLTALLTASSGRKPDMICGKPYAPMADIVNKQVNVSKERVLMIGDRLYTDILFGINNGYRTLAVLTGEISRELLDSSDITPTYVMQSVASLLCD
ncbi:MAG: HAD-IIA family hydrolase [Christensenellaceae bacterium]|jgi:NagD protein|nr:HAD-IIA family hydrolase [Christensenellaceae bacterium]